MGIKMTDKLNEGDIPTMHTWLSKDVWDAYVSKITKEIESYDELVKSTGVDFTKVDFSSYKAPGSSIIKKT